MSNKASVLISVVIPTFNCEKYICDAVRSVINQSYDNWEIIIVDDNSTDNTSEFIRPFLSDKIKYHHINHSGPLQSRAYGASIANGEYLVFLDADDCFHRNLLEILVENVNDLVFFKERIFYELQEYNDSNSLNNIVTSEIIGVGEYDFSHNYLACSMVRKSLFMDIYHEIPNCLKQFRFSEDMMVCSMLASNVKEITKISYPLYFYRRSNSSSITHTLTFADYMGRFDIVDFLYKYLNHRGFNKTYFGCRHIFSPFIYLVKTKEPFLIQKNEFNKIRNSYSFKIHYLFSLKHKIMFVLIRLRFYKCLHLFIKLLVALKKV